MNQDDFLDVAHQIGERLARQAIWDGSVCTWEVCTSDRSGPGRSTPQRASGRLYQGTSGIAWFLAELARATSDAELARVAEGGLRHALDQNHGSRAPGLRPCPRPFDPCHGPADPAGGLTQAFNAANGTLRGLKGSA